MANFNMGILEDKNARTVFLSQGISLICDKMMSLGLVWYLTTQFSIQIVPWFLTVSFLPHLFMSYYSSKVINQYGILKTLVHSEFARGAVLLIFFFLLFFLAEKSNAFIVFLFISVFLVGIGSSLFNPAILSLPPKIVSTEKIAPLNALLDTTFSLSNILGAAFAIFFLNLFDIQILVLINAISFFIAGCIQKKITYLNGSVDQGKDEVKNDQSKDISPIFVLEKYPLIKRMLISFLMINIVFTPILVMIPWYVKNIYKGSGSDLAIVEGAMGLGAFIIGVMLSWGEFQVSPHRRIGMLAIICFLFGFFFQAFSYSTSTVEGAFLLFLIGVLSTFLNVQILTYFQTELLANEVPAIMVAVNVISVASMPLSFAISGLLFPLIDIPQFALICGVITCVIAFVIPSFLDEKKFKMKA